MKSDRELLAQYVAKGSDDAMTEIVGRYSKMVYAICFGVLRDVHAAEDSVQATFVLLIRHAKGLSPSGSLASWLSRTARTSALDARKLKLRRAKHEHESRREVRVSGELASSRYEGFDVIESALAALPPVQREALLMRYVENMSESEVACALGCPEGTVHTRVRRGLERMRAACRKGGLKAPAHVPGYLCWIAQTAPVGLASIAEAICPGRTPASPDVVWITEEVSMRLKWAKIKLGLVAATATVTLVFGALGLLPAAEKTTASPSPPLVRTIEAGGRMPKVDQRRPAKIEAPVEGLAFGPVSEGLAARIEHLPNHKAAPFAFLMTVKNVSDRTIKPLGLNCSSNWRLHWRSAANLKTVYEGCFHTLGADWPVAVYPSNSRSFTFQDEGGAFQPNPGPVGGGAESKPWEQLPPGVYYVQAEYGWGPRVRRNCNGFTRRYFGMLRTNEVKVEIPVRVVAATPGPPGYGARSDGLAAKLEALNSRDGTLASFRITLVNLSSRKIHFGSCEGKDWSFVFCPVDALEQKKTIFAVRDFNKKGLMVSQQKRDIFGMEAGGKRVILASPKGEASEPFCTVRWTLEGASPVRLPPGRYQVSAFFEPRRRGKEGSVHSYLGSGSREWDGDLVTNTIAVEVGKETFNLGFGGGE